MLASLGLIAFSYLCGSIPTGVLLSRLRGLDPRDLGSGNIGATNVARTAGPVLGLLTLCGDAVKGLVPVSVAVLAGATEPVAVMVGLAAFLGHLYSCFLGFQGGKGVATSLGVLTGLAPAAMAVVVPAFAVLVLLTRYVSVASMLAALGTPPLLAALGYGPSTTVGALAMGALIVARHRDNIRRLRHGTESRIGERRARADSGVA